MAFVEDGKESGPPPPTPNNPNNPTSSFPFPDAFELALDHLSKQDARRMLGYLIICAEAAERWVDMCQWIKALIPCVHASGEDLDVEERNSVSVAFKNLIAPRRISWKQLDQPALCNDDPTLQELRLQYKMKIAQEIIAISQEALELLNKMLVRNETNDDSARVFYLKMAGDYYRYQAEVGDSGYADQSEASYQAAMELAMEKLSPLDPMRLGVMLNYSVCMYEILDQKDAAVKLAQSAFDTALGDIQEHDPLQHQDTRLLLQLLRDNLRLWNEEMIDPTNDDDDDDDDDNDNDNDMASNNQTITQSQDPQHTQDLTIDDGFSKLLITSFPPPPLPLPKEEEEEEKDTPKKHMMIDLSLGTNHGKQSAQQWPITP